VLAAGPAEGPGGEDDREEDVPGGDDQLLADRVGGGGLGRGFSGEGRRVHRLGDANAAGGGRDAVGDRVGGGDGGDVVEADRDPVGAEEDGDYREPGGVAAELWQDQAGKGAPRRSQDCPTRDELLSRFASRSQKTRASRTRRTIAPTAIRRTSPTCSATKPSLIEKESLTVRNR
jgi:hypothetical protein